MNWICNLAKSNGYTINEINKIYHNINNNKIRNPLKKPEDQAKYIGSITYHPRISKTINKITKPHNLKIGLKTFNNKSLLIKNKDQTKSLDKCGVYQIFLPGNSEIASPVYVGCTKRKLEIRLKEHYRDIRTGNDKTALAKFCRRYECEPLWEMTKISNIHNRVELIRLQEAITIYQQQKNAVNDDEGTILPDAWKVIIDKTRTKKKERKTIQHLDIQDEHSHYNIKQEINPVKSSNCVDVTEIQHPPEPHEIPDHPG